MRHIGHDGGPAFPSHGSVGEVVGEGMSLRDYLAAHAPLDEIPEKFLAEERPEWKSYMRGSGVEENIYAVSLMKWKAKRDSTYRYLWADAMLAARGGKPE